jgi:hypothetical protein
MSKTIVRYNNCELSFTDDDVLDIENVLFEGDYNCHKRHLWLIHDHGFTICVVEADSLQDALDEAVDADKLDRFQIHPENESDRDDYMTSDVSEMAAGYDPECPEYVDADGVKWWWKVEPASLGNAGEPFDIDSIGYVALPLPKRSVTRLFGECIEATDGHFA